MVSDHVRTIIKQTDKATFIPLTPGLRLGGRNDRIGDCFANARNDRKFWIPACAGMTKLGRSAGKNCFCRAYEIVAIFYKKLLFLPINFL